MIWQGHTDTVIGRKFKSYNFLLFFKILLFFRLIAAHFSVYQDIFLSVCLKFTQKQTIPDKKIQTTAHYIQIFTLLADIKGKFI